jgi:hypothetical protein
MEVALELGAQICPTHGERKSIHPLSRMNSQHAHRPTNIDIPDHSGREPFHTITIDDRPDAATALRNQTRAQLKHVESADALISCNDRPTR